MTRQVNNEVEVNAFYFAGTKKVKIFPEQITLGNEHYTFLRSGIQLVISKGQEIIRLFTMTDGTRRFQIKKINDTWVLLKIEQVPGEAAL